MKIIVTHSMPDLDAITSVWLLKKFLPGWENAHVEFVPAGERYGNQELGIRNQEDPIEHIDGDELIHVDTGLGPLDHHQTSDDRVSAASRVWDFVKQIQISNLKSEISEKMEAKFEAIDRIVQVAIDVDHFKEVFWEEPTADYHEFSILALIDGVKLAKPGQDEYCLTFVSECLDYLLHNFENRLWAEKEISQNGVVFETKFGKAIGFETINDTVIKLAQKMGYVLVVRKDPRKGYVRIKARPSQVKSSKLKVQNDSIDLTPVYEKLKELDPGATWFLHVSKKMLLNGSAKNPKMKPSTLSLHDIIEVLKNI